MPGSLSSKNSHHHLGPVKLVENVVETTVQFSFYKKEYVVLSLINTILEKTNTTLATKQVNTGAPKHYVIIV